MSPERGDSPTLNNTHVAFTKELRFGESFVDVDQFLLGDKKDDDQDKQSELSVEVNASEIEKKVAAMRLEPINIDIETGKAFAKPLPQENHISNSRTSSQQHLNDKESNSKAN